MSYGSIHSTMPPQEPWGVGRREDALFLGPGGTGKSHLAQAIGQAAIQQGYRVLYRETHVVAHPSLSFVEEFFVFVRFAIDALGDPTPHKPFPTREHFPDGANDHIAVFAF